MFPRQGLPARLLLLGGPLTQCSLGTYLLCRWPLYSVHQVPEKDSVTDRVSAQWLWAVTQAGGQRRLEAAFPK